MGRGIFGVVAIAVCLFVLTGCFAADAGSAPTSAPPDAEGPESTLPPPADPLPLADLATFSGVAMLNAGSNCTGTLIDTGVPAGPAYVLTNGHCTGGIGRSAQQTTAGLEWFGEAEFLRAAGNLDGTFTVAVEELAYSTMRHTDTAIVRLDSTLGALQEAGLTAVPVADAEPAPGLEVVNVGVPVQDLADDEWVLRRGDCTLGAQHTLIEFLWLWFDVWSNDCPGIIQGSSGSPLFETDASGAPVRIVGMINTTSWGVTAARGGACFMNRPCQVTEDGAVMVEETSYAQSVAGVGSCFDGGSGRFALGGDCPLETSDVWAESGGGAFRGGDLPDASGRLPEVRLAGEQAGTVRTALTPLGEGTACTDAATYTGTAPQDLPEAGEPWDLKGVVIPVPLPETEGHYLLCAVRGESYERAASVLFSVDRTPPVLPATVDIEDMGEGSVMVRPHFDPPELSTVRFTWGDPDTVDCDDTSAFGDLRMVPPILGPDELPALFCLYGLDSAGNSTPVERIDIPAR